jgi:hypothetical protein
MWQWLKRKLGLFTPTEQAIYLSRLQIYDLRDRDAIALAEYEKEMGELNAQILRLKAKKRAREAMFHREAAVRAVAIGALQADVDRLERGQFAPTVNEPQPIDTSPRITRAFPGGE